MVANDLEINSAWQTAIKAVDSGEDIYITGPAGTGKSTLLQYLRPRINPCHAVVAPTGVSALNVDGQTLHSFFRFPIGYISPDSISGNSSELFQKLNTLIIDEVSMVRADLLEAVNLSLARSRGNNRPFGGVQIVMIGDHYQLPPVVDNDELHSFFRAEYGGAFFFNAPAYRFLKPRVITLEKNYRQQNEEFLRLLAKVRKATISDAELELLNRRRVPILASDETYIHLTTTKKAAEERNRRFLDRIPDKRYTYEARIDGKFPESAYPTDELLELKAGAKVMMVKNDLGGRWVNGTIGRVAALNDVEILVEIDDQFHIVGRERWETYSHQYVSREHRVLKEVVGSFVQFPVRLSWAMTIHKSQGQTLQKVFIDLGSGAFASGQTYVALSRCTTLEGIVLSRPIRRKDIIVDPLISKYDSNH